MALHGRQQAQLPKNGRKGQDRHLGSVRSSNSLVDCDVDRHLAMSSRELVHQNYAWKENKPAERFCVCDGYLTLRKWRFDRAASEVALSLHTQHCRQRNRRSPLHSLHSSLAYTTPAGRQADRQGGSAKTNAVSRSHPVDSLVVAAAVEVEADRAAPLEQDVACKAELAHAPEPSGPTQHAVPSSQPHSRTPRRPAMELLCQLLVCHVCWRPERHLMHCGR